MLSYEIIAEIFGKINFPLLMIAFQVAIGAENLK
jgi:hypothetical protein